MANDLIRTVEEGEDLTGQATAAITGKRFVRISGARTSKFSVLATAADGNNYKVAQVGVLGGYALGVSKYDQPNIGGKVGVARGGVAPVTAGATMAAGTIIMSDATGQAIAWVTAAGEANYKLGILMDDVVSGSDAEVLLFD